MKIKKKLSVNWNSREALTKWAMEFSELCAEASIHLEDKHLTAFEYENIQKKLMEDIAVGLALLEA